MEVLFKNVRINNSLRAAVLAFNAQFKEIKRSAEELLRQEIVVIGPFLMQKVLGIVESYNDARRNLYSIMPQLTKKEIMLPSFTEDYVRVKPLEALERIKNICEFIIEFLEQYSYGLTKEEKDRIDSLREELYEVENFNLSLYLHLKEALSEYEHRHYLSTVLLAGKVICFVLEQIPGKDDSEKISELIRERIVPSNLRQELLKGARNARNYYIHEINAIPEPAESLDMLAKAFNFTKLLMNYTSARSGQTSTN